MPYRQTLAGEAPWYFTMKYPNVDDDGWGDRGLIVRSYRSKLGGVEQASPAFSVFCGNLEISVPSEVGNTLYEGDFVEMRLELVVLPRLEPSSNVDASGGSDVDFDTALAHSNSVTLAKLETTAATTNDMIALHARGHLTTTALVGNVESHYPIRVCTAATTAAEAAAAAGGDGDGDDVLFTVSGSALGFTPIVICGLASHAVGAGRGLWVRPEGVSAWSLVDQSVFDATDFWQTNFEASSGTWELVYNVELFANATEVAFGNEPFVPSPLPTGAPSPHPTQHPTPLPTPSPTGLPSPSPSQLPTQPPSTLDAVSVSVGLELLVGLQREPTTTDEAALKTTVATALALGESSIRNFKVSSAAAAAAAASLPSSSPSSPPFKSGDKGESPVGKHRTNATTGAAAALASSSAAAAAAAAAAAPKESQTAAGSDAQVFLDLQKNNEDPVYGGGFRLALQAFESDGVAGNLPLLLSLVKERRGLPR